MSGVVTPSESSWVALLTGLSPRVFGKWVPLWSALQLALCVGAARITHVSEQDKMSALPMPATFHVAPSCKHYRTRPTARARSGGTAQTAGLMNKIADRDLFPAGPQ